MGRPWTCGFYKAPVTGPVLLGLTDLDSDGHADLVYHGVPNKAVCCYSADHYYARRNEMGLPEMPCGAFGENSTISGVAENPV